jgi:predicted DCC family thiol-disulfide oxidoreductase YuxK
VNGTLVFDGNCGFCTRSRAQLLRFDRHHRIRTIPFQNPDAVARTGLDLDALSSSVWWLDDDGSLLSGAEAAAAAISAALGWRLPLWLQRLPGIRQLSDRVYAWVAANRFRLPGAAPWCQNHPTDCDSVASNR